MYARDPLTGNVFEVGGGGTNEVFIGAVDPYVTSANSTDELWLDTSKTPPILKGRVNNAWVEVTAASDPEVVVGGTIPSPGPDKLWLDPGGVMTPPTPGDPIKALWAYDGTAGPTNGWHKVEMGSSEVEVHDVEPDTLNPDWELWVDTAPAPAPVQTDEVWVGPDDPRVAVPGSVQELWLDTSVTPPLLRYWDGTAWVASLYPYLPLAGGALTGPVTSSSTVTVAGAITANGGITMGAGDLIQFPNEAAPTTKIVMYGTPTSGFGHGVEGGNLTAFGSGFKFRQSSMTGTQWAYIDATCGGGRVITETNGDGRYMPKTPGWVALTKGGGLSGNVHYRDYGSMIGVKISINKSGNQVNDGQHVADFPAPPYAGGFLGSNKEGNIVQFQMTALGQLYVKSGGNSLDVFGVFMYPKP